MLFKSIGSNLFLIAAFAIATIIPLSTVTAPQVQAQTTPSIMVTGYTGVSQNFSLTDLQALPPTSGYGGFYQPNQKQINNGNWTGVSLSYLCNQIAGGITSTCTISVTGQGTNNFTYEMVANGTNINEGYATYNNATGLEQNQTQPITILLAYIVNGSSLSSNIGPAPRLVAVGPEGLLMIGTGGRSITQVTITNSAPPTPTPVATATPTPTPSPAPTSTPTTAPSPTPTPTFSSTPTISPTTTPTPATTTPAPTETPATPTTSPSQTPSESPTPTQTASTAQPTNTPSPTTYPTMTPSPTTTTNETQGTVLILGALAATTIIVIALVAYLFERAKKRRK